MKLIPIILGALIVSPSAGRTQPNPFLAGNAQAAPVLVERGPNHRKWERRVTTTIPVGEVRQEKHVIVQIGAGLNYRDQQTGALVDANPIIEPYPNGAVARQGQHKCAFA